MRDPKRIKPFLAEIEKIWEKCPDLRFGQLMMNIKFDRDPFFMEESEFLEAMKRKYSEDKT